MNRTTLLKALIVLALTALLIGVIAPRVRPAQAVGEASTQFGVFAPASAVSTRDSTVIVTALQDNTTVDIVDDGADGDTDDTHTGIVLNKGQSYIVYIWEGAVNDDGSRSSVKPVKQDGDFFVITSNKPVIGGDMTINTDWEHDFVPADNRRMSGTSFYLYRQLGLSGAAATNDVLDVFAYNDNTTIKITDITLTSTFASGYTSVVGDAQGKVVFTTTLQTGQDLLEVRRSKPVLTEGHTYHIVSNKDVSVMYGALAQGQAAARDGGAYVPGKNGTSADKTFYFIIPSAYKYPSDPQERELRFAAYDHQANITIRGWNTKTNQWDTISKYPLPAFGHAELIGSTLGSFTDTGNVTRNYYLYEITSDATISVFESNWLETGSYGTSDIAMYISSENGTGAGQSFLAYIGPPGTQADGNQESHLTISSHFAVTVEVSDADSYGEYIELYNPTSAAISLANWTLSTTGGQVITLPPTATIGAKQTFLLEYHEKATNAAANYVYGTINPNFKLRNGADTIVLANATGSYTDQVSYSFDSNWKSHGVYHALERLNPNLPFTAVNARDAVSYTAKSTANLGDYYGSPGARTGASGTGVANVVINEVMTGRYYSRFSLAPNGYRDVELDTTEWEGLRNGETPNTRSGNPESPYLVVESDMPISVLDGNWNDNWLTYGTGILQPDPYVSYAANYYSRQAGQPITFTAYAYNQYGALINPHTEINLPRGVNYTPGSFSTPSQIGGVTPSETLNPDGSWTIAWSHGLPLPPPDVYRFQVWGVISNSLNISTLLQSTVIVRGTDGLGVNTYSSQDSAVVNVAPLNEPTAVRDIVINEVDTQPLLGTQWIELHNKSTNDLNIGGWQIGNERNFTYTFAANTFVANDAYIVVHLGAGTDDATNFYAGAGSVDALDGTEEALSLYNASAHTTQTLIDFVQWDDNGVFARPGKEAIAVAASQWISNTYVTSADVNQSIGRDRNATDRNTATEWDNTGGADAAAPTRGAINVTIAGADVTPPAPITTLKAVAVLGQPGMIRLTWTNPTDADLAGIKLIRSDLSYPQSLNAGVEIYDGLNRVFTDTNLTPGALVYYTAFAYDTTGNISWPIPPGAQVRAIVPQRVHLAFEDQKNVNWSDWDSNDFVVMQDTAVQLNTAGVTEIAVLFKAEARGSAFDHAFNLSVPLEGDVDVAITRYDGQGQPLPAADFGPSFVIVPSGVDVPIFTRTWLALPPAPGTFTANVVNGTQPVLGWSARITLTVSDPSANQPEFLTPPFDPWLHVIDTDQDIHLLQAGALDNSQTVNYAGPLQGRNLPLGLSFNQAWHWPLEAVPIWEAYPQYTTFITSGNQLNTAWFTQPVVNKVWGASLAQQTSSAIATPAHGASPAAQVFTTAGPIFASPTIVDLNQDGSNELIAVSEYHYLYVWKADGSLVPGWPQYVGDSVRSTPAIGDIDGDGNLEIVVGSDGGQLYAWHADGSSAFAFPIMLGGAIKSSPVLANLDGAAGDEIIVHANNAKVYALHGNGTSFAHWPQSTGGVTETFGSFIIASTPAVGDIDADGVPDIVVSGTDGRVRAWHIDGTPLTTLWPRDTQSTLFASPVIVDLNGDGYRDIVAATGDGYVYAWRGDGWLLPGFPVRLPGGILASPTVADMRRDGQQEVVVGTLTGRVYVIRRDGSIMFGWPQVAGAPIYSSPIVANLDTDIGQEILVGTLAGKLHAWHADGYELNTEALPWTEWPKLTTDWIVASPAVGDLNQDGSVDIAVGSFDKNVYVWSESATFDPSDALWPTFHGNVARTGFIDTGAIQALPPVFAVYLPVIRR